ncbi:DUF1385 domain-containing protein [Bacillus siamensis]|uniref:DUF1385 domain-containing protein n=1 Tax=Bacillus siamensis TaxID=659243 RepID=UPI002E22764A|nr:DUF1385 domain-containing protein [Bacillus siamensis]MED0776874.1 DUF1385 domain-containing protein [Bacillus siamensis]MED0780493.1 DUF1385 domain-containing protein [Bacillus siamensis]MED0833312.1 DUF1385 domain-containing protein [Bacillus siamensis]
MSKHKTPPAYGGQAVVEGVMFGGRKNYVTAIRRNDGSIDFFKLPRVPNPKLSVLKKIPFLRGIVAIIEASANGTKHLNFSSERYGLDPQDEAKLEQEDKKGSGLSMFFSLAVIGVLSFLFSKFVFTLVPVFLAELVRPVFSSDAAQIGIESLFKLILLLGYIYFLSMTPLIKRVFQYHGAEHKVINCYEQNLPITIENVQKQSRLHYRCGSSFILFTIIVGMFVYLLVPTDPLWVRILDRIALIPAVLGISFEVLQLTNRVRNIPVLKVLGYPGLWLQLLTTKEPEDDQVEVAIESFNELLRLEDISEQSEKPSHNAI